ncbi:MAG: universal stress protein [Myxococcota bacterium]
MKDTEIDGPRRRGRVTRSIIENAGTIDADPIVMGTAGLSGLERLLVGGVAEKVVRMSPMSGSAPNAPIL